MNLDAKALTGFIKEIEDSRLRQRAETEFQRDVFKRARKKFFDVKAMRIVLQRRAMDSSVRDEQDYNVECYELALAGKRAAIEALEAGKSVREAAEIGGISTGAAGNLRRGVQESTFVDSTTGDDLPASEAAGTGVEQAPGVEGQLVASNPVGSSTPSIQPNKENDHGHRDFRDGSGSGAPQVQSERQGRGVGDQAVDGVAGDDAGTDRPAQRQNGDRGRDSGDPACADGQHVGGLCGDQGVVDTSAGLAFMPDGGPAHDIEESSDGVEVRHAEARNTPGSVPGEDMNAPPSRLVGAPVREAATVPCAGVTPGSEDTRSFDEIAGPMPERLRRLSPRSVDARALPEADPVA